MEGTFCTSAGCFLEQKGGLVSLTQGLAKELAPEIQVNGIAPGLIIMPKFVNKKLELFESLICMYGIHTNLRMKTFVIMFNF